MLSPKARVALGNQMRICHARFGVYGASFMAGPGKTVSDLFRESQVLQGYTEYRFTTVEQIEERGYKMYATFDVPHYTLELPRALDDDLWEELTGSGGLLMGPERAPEWRAL